MRGQVFVAISALAALVAFPAAAQQYPTYHDEHVATQQQCQQSRNNRTVGGAVLGGVLGALLGREVSGRGHRQDGALLGAVVGATAGGAIGRNTSQCAHVPQGSYDPYNGQSSQQYPNDPYGQAPYGDDSGLEGGPYQESGYGGGYGGDYGRNEDCRMGQVITRDPYGREIRENVMMCQGRDGVWRPQN
jgi:hypothetical protein